MLNRRTPSQFQDTKHQKSIYIHVFHFLQIIGSHSPAGLTKLSQDSAFASINVQRILVITTVFVTKDLCCYIEFAVIKKLDVDSSKA